MIKIREKNKLILLLIAILIILPITIIYPKYSICWPILYLICLFRDIWREAPNDNNLIERMPFIVKVACLLSFIAMSCEVTFTGSCIYSLSLFAIILCLQEIYGDS